MIDLAFAANAVSWFLQVSLVVAAAATLTWVLRVHAPGVRYAYWRAVLVICLALPWLQGRITRTSAAVSTVDAVDTTAPLASPPSVSTAMSIDWVWVVAALAVAGGLARMLWIAAGYVRLRRLRHAGKTCEAAQNSTSSATSFRRLPKCATCLRSNSPSRSARSHRSSFFPSR